MAAGRALISLDEARALLIENVETVGSEVLGLERLDRRILAETIASNHDQPREARSLMDGLAVADGAPPNANFRLVGEAAAGRPYTGALRAGQAVRIATGAVVPVGASRVVPIEVVDCSDDGTARVIEWPMARFVRLAGSDFRRGERLLDPGTVLGPAAIALIAAANLAQAAVYRRPRVAILTSGDELVEPGSGLDCGSSIDSAGYGLAALARRWNGDPVRLPTVADELDPVAMAMASALEQADVLVTVGGASVGERDVMRSAAKVIGAKLRFERINLQPGKPCWHARSSNGRLILGLPGNPGSAFVCAYLLLRPLLMQLSGGDSAVHFVHAMLDGGLRPNGGREQYVRARSTSVAGDPLRVSPLANQDSGLQATLAQATHLIRQLPDDRGAQSGDSVETITLDL